MAELRKILKVIIHMLEYVLRDEFVFLLKCMNNT